MTEVDAIEYILSLPKVTYPLGNEQLSELLALLGSPDSDMKVIHIAGTNGKGSVAAMLGSVLTEAGYKTGVFTSPYILSFNERIKIGNEPIDALSLSEHTRTVENICRMHRIKISQFAFILAVALLFYREKGCDLVVLEAGLGGRLDATNVIKSPVLSVITSISLDHTDYLGDTISQIASEKCGIIKENGTVISYRNTSDALSVIKDFCHRKNAELHIADEAIPTENGFIVKDREYPLALNGSYQADNGSVALCAIHLLRKKGLSIPDSALMQGLSKCTHRARFERVRENIIVDGAHNPDAARALVSAMSEYKEKTAVLAMMEDKAIELFLSELKKGFDTVIVTELDMPRCIKADSLAALASARGFNVRVITDTVLAFQTAEKEPFAVVCGSLYLAGKALSYWK